MFLQKSNNREFYSQFFKLYIILVLQNIVTISVNLADNMMLGSYSEITLSGVAAVNQIQFVYQQILTALGDGVVIIGSQYWGQHKIDPMKKVSAIAMRTGLIIACMLFCATSAVPGGLVGLFTTDADIVGEGVRYIYIVKYSYLFFAVTQILLATLRSVEIVAIAFKLSMVTFFVNCGINYVLIYGHFGAPRLGGQGAAIGTLTARILETLILLIYIHRKEDNLKLRMKDYLQFDSQLRKDYFKLTSPMLVVQSLWGVNTAMQTVILGHMTSAAIAANSIASTLFMVVKSTAVGAASAASIVIGKLIGMGDIPATKRAAISLQRIFLVIGVCSGIVLFFLRIPILNIYRLSPETKEMANAFLIVLSIVVVGMSYQMPTNNGIIRGGGNAMFVVKMDLISIWCIVIPLSLFMAFVVKASPVVVICCLNADQIFKGIPAYLESHYGNWIRKLTR